MADKCATYTYSSVTINGAPNTDTLVLTEDEGSGVEGLDGAPIRRQIDPLAATDGSDLGAQPALFAGRTIRFTGRVHIGTMANPRADPVEYWSRVMVLQKATIAALEAQLNAATPLAWTDSDGDSRSIDAMYGIPGGEIAFSGPSFDIAFTFSLVTEGPTIA